MTQKDDTISRQAAIDAIKSYWKNEVDRIPKESTNFDVFTQICDSILSHNASICKVIDKLPSAQPEQQWIPCSERLPEKHGYYIVQTDGSRNHVIDIAEYGLFWHNMKQEMMWNKASKILAWMPLPEPYMLDEEE